MASLRSRALSAGRLEWTLGGRLAWSAAVGPLLPVVCATVLWAVSLRDVDLSRMNDLGLISGLPLPTYIALIVLTVSFCLAAHQRQTRVPTLLLHVAALIAIIHGTPAILYGSLRYSWAWKHIGIVDYIQRHGSVDPNVSSLGAYHSWPGFFTLGALITEVAGFKSALSFAAWAPVFFNLLFLGALLLILEALTADRRLIWLSIWLFYLTNWVGQDYFAPQALNYFLHLVILGICLRWFAMAPPPLEPALGRWPAARRVVSLLRGPIGGPARDHPASTGPRARQQPGMLTIVILLFVVIASSHQLTPLMTILAVGGLVVFQRCSARSLPILMIVVTATWIVYMAVAFLDGNVQWIIKSIGQLNHNADSNLINLAQASPGQTFVAIVDRLLTASLWALALLGGIRRLRNGYWDLPCMLLAAAPFLMLAGNSYGGEMLFRVYFFALPFMALLAGALLYPSPESGTTWRTAAAAVALSSLLLAGLCIAYYGKERMNYFTKNEVDAAQYLYGVAPAGSLVLGGSFNYPSVFRDYEQYTHLSFVSMPKTQQAQLDSDPVGVISRLLSDRRYAAGYLIITRSQKAHVNMTGTLPAGSLDRIEGAVIDSGRFKVVFANPDATIFTLNGAAGGGAPPPAPAPSPPAVATPAAEQPSGVIVFHSSLETPGTLQLYAARPDGGSPRRIPGTPRYAAFPRLAPDGRRLAFVGNDGTGDDLYTINLDGSGLARLTHGPGSNRYPAWSPDGRRLAFGSDRDGNWELYTIGADGGGLARVTADPADDNLPSWSPDGQWLAFQSDRGGQGMRLYKVRADGGGVTTLTGGPGNDRYPAWSPDGKRLAFYSDRGGGLDQLYTVDADGGHEAQLARSSGRDQLPAWSPDGRWLAFASEREGGWGIYVVPAAGGEARPVARLPDAWAPAWAAATSGR